MPIFEYVCRECRHEFELIVNGNRKAACPSCQSRRLEKQLSVFAVSAKGNAATNVVDPLHLGLNITPYDADNTAAVETPPKKLRLLVFNASSCRLFVMQIKVA